MDLTNLSDMFSGDVSEDSMFNTSNYGNLQNAGEYIDAQTGAWQNSLGHRNGVVPYGNESFYRDELNLGDSINPSQVSFTKTPLGNESYEYQTYLGNKELKNWTADYGDKSFLDEFVEVAAPAGVSMIGGHILGGAIGAANPGATFFDNPITQKIFNQAFTGAGMSTIQGGNPLTGAVQGAVGAAIPGYNIGGQVGIENPGLQNVFNRGLQGATSAAIGGGDVLRSGVSAATPSILASLGNLFGGNEMPDTGTLGGTMQDGSGESSVTLGGQRTPDQQAANYQALDAGVPTSMQSQLSDAPASSSSAASTGVPQQAGSIPGWAQAISGAMGMYSAYDNQRRAREMMKGLSGLYSSNSPYAKQLRQKLERQDAARGRRSDYAGRETQLAAALADRNMAMTPTMANLQGMQNQGLMSMFNNALKLGTNPDVSSWLGSMFKG